MEKRTALIVVISLLVLFFSFSSTADLKGQDSTQKKFRLLTPPNLNSPTQVYIGLYVDEIINIQEVDNTFEIEGFMDLKWNDPRLVFDPVKQGTDSEAYLESNARSKLEEIWWPDLTFANEVSPRNVEDIELIILPDGTVEYKEKFSVKLEAILDLVKFPFDSQKLEIEIESFAWAERFLQLVEDKEKTGFSTDFEIPEWHIESTATEIESVKEIKDRENFSEFLLTVDVYRHWGFYVFKVLIPLLLLVAISWVVFWMPSSTLSERMGLSFTGLLTVVAYQFIATGNLPKVPYFTFMDTIITLSFVLMMLTVAENLSVHLLKFKNRPERALKLDETSRWLFPSAYLLGILVLALCYLS